MNPVKPVRIIALLLAVTLPTVAQATNGYFTAGYTLQQMAMGGAGTAMVEDASVATINPAGPAWTGTQIDFEFSLFVPQRSYDAGPRGSGANTGIFTVTPTDGAVRSVNRHYYIPGLTFNYALDDRTSIGVTMFGNGGLDTKYGRGSATFGTNLPLGLTGVGALGGALPAFQATCQGTFGGGAPITGSSDLLGFCGNGRKPKVAGVDLIQMFIAPYYSRKITHTFSVGIEPLIGAQRFKSDGLAAFEKFSNHPDKVSGNGYSYSYGLGVRVGFLWAALPGVGIGGSYQSHVFMTHFKKYKGLFSDNGKFDVPSSFNIGIQLHPWSAHRFVFDFQRIYYSEIDSVGQPLDANAFVNQCAVPRLLAQLTGGAEGSTAPSPACLGGASGPGFNWHDVSVFKFGYQFQHRSLKLRVGYSVSPNQPIRSNAVLFNILAPGVIERHLTGGVSYQVTHAITLNLAFVYAFGHRVSGKNPLSNTPGTVTVGQNGNIVGLAFDAGSDANDQNITLYMRQFRAAVGFSYRFD